MEISLMMPTHGLLYRDEENAFLPAPDTNVDIIAVARLAESLGFHSLWFSDHVCMTKSSDSGHPANWSGTRAYPGKAYMLDALVGMGAVVAATDRIRVAPSVLISPYRHPLSDARQLATVDVISKGRLIAGVGAGWMKEEFEAIGLPYEARGRMLDECVQIYLKSWLDEWVDFEGEFYRFHDVSMDPKPIQQPPPLVFGAATKAGARRAAKWGSGLYLLFLDPYPDPNRYQTLFDQVRAEMDAAGRNFDEFEFSVMVSCLPTDPDDPKATAEKRQVLTGTAAQMVEDLEAFAKAGYSRCVLHPEVRSGTFVEYLELVERIGKEIIPLAHHVSCRTATV